jgi:hypothetical protein
VATAKHLGTEPKDLSMSKKAILEWSRNSPFFDICKSSWGILPKNCEAQKEQLLGAPGLKPHDARRTPAHCAVVRFDHITVCQNRLLFFNIFYGSG